MNDEIEKLRKLGDQDDRRTDKVYDQITSMGTEISRMQLMMEGMSLKADEIVKLVGERGNMMERKAQDP